MKYFVCILSLLVGPLAIGENREFEDWDAIKTVIQEGESGPEARALMESTLGGQTLLIRAINDGRKDVVDLLLEKGVNIEEPDERYEETPLIWAAKQKDEGIFDSLLQKKADVNAKSSDDDTALMAAASRGFTGRMEKLRKAGADIHAVNRFGENAFMVAIAKGQASSVEYLFHAGATINQNLSGGQWSSLLLNILTLVDPPPEDLGNRIHDIYTFIEKSGFMKKDPKEIALFLAVLNRQVNVIQKLMRLGPYNGYSPTIRNGLLGFIRDLPHYNEVIMALEKGGNNPCKVSVESRPS